MIVFPCIIRRRMGRGMWAHVFILFALWVGSSPLVAQGSAKCSTVTNPANWVSDVTRIFMDSSFAATRAYYGIDTLTASEPRDIVTDEQVCGRLITATRAAFRKMYATHVSIDTRELYFFRMGSYYVVMALPVVPKGMVMNGSAAVMLFQQNYDFITRIDW